MTKSIVVKFVGSKNRAAGILQLLPGTTVADVLKKLNLTGGYQLSDAQNPDRCSAPATTSTPAARMAPYSTQAHSSTQALNQGAAMMGFFSQHKNVTRIAAPHGAVRRSTATLIEQRGWKKTWGAWSGPFATHYGTWPGKIEKAGDTLRVFIQNPPAEIHHHPKYACFHSRDDGWYRIHLHTQPSRRRSQCCHPLRRANPHRELQTLKGTNTC